MPTDDYKWPEFQPMPGYDTAMVRVVVDARVHRYGLPNRYCFTHFPADVSLETVLAFIKEKDLPIDTDSTYTEIDVETREWIPGNYYDEMTRLEYRGRFNPWVFVKRLQGANPFQSYRALNEHEFMLPSGIEKPRGCAKMCPPGTPVLDATGNKIGECDNPRIVDGNLVTDMMIDKDKMPELKQRSVDLWPSAEAAYIPQWPKPPKAPTPLPGTKRYVALLRGEMVAESDNTDEVLAYIYIGQADTLCDREFKVNWPAVEYVPADWTPPANPNPVIAKTLNDAMRKIEEHTRIPKEVFWSREMQYDPVVKALFHEYELSQNGTFEDFLMTLCVELWNLKNQYHVEIVMLQQEKAK